MYTDILGTLGLINKACVCGCLKVLIGMLILNTFTREDYSVLHISNLLMCPLTKMTTRCREFTRGENKMSDKPHSSHVGEENIFIPNSLQQCFYSLKS